jgi:Ca2+-binding EF-hand superfamily protein
MAQTAKNQKFEMLFDWFDQNDDGSLTEDDFIAMASLFTELTHPDDRPNKDALRAAFARWWRILLEAAGTQDRIERPEFISIMHSHITGSQHFEDVVMGIADALMQALDTDGNGTLTGDEYVQMYSSLGVNQDISAASFQRLDRNGDGVISQAEFRSAIEDFYLSDDDAPGNWLLGPTVPGR